MKKLIMKKLFTAVAILPLISLCFILMSHAEQNGTSSVLEHGDYFYRILDDGTAEIQRYVGSDQSIIIPEDLDGVIITSP